MTQRRIPQESSSAPSLSNKAAAWVTLLNHPAAGGTKTGWYVGDASYPSISTRTDVSTYLTGTTFSTAVSSNTGAFQDGLFCELRFGTPTTTTTISGTLSLSTFATNSAYPPNPSPPITTTFSFTQTASFDNRTYTLYATFGSKTTILYNREYPIQAYSGYLSPLSIGANAQFQTPGGGTPAASFNGCRLRIGQSAIGFSEQGTIS